MEGLTGRKILMDQLAAGIQDDELDYLVSKVGLLRVRDAVRRVESIDESVAIQREKMPGSFDINGVIYYRKS